jgi:hypothetical protein
MRCRAQPLLVVLVLCGAGLASCRGPARHEAAATRDPQRQRVVDFWNRLSAATEARTRRDFAEAARLYAEALVLEPRHEDGLYLGQCRRSWRSAGGAGHERLIAANPASARTSRSARRHHLTRTSRWTRAGRAAPPPRINGEGPGRW